MSPQDIAMLREHEMVLDHLSDLMKLDKGRTIFKYLFKSLDVGELPERGIHGDLLFETLGFLRAGKSIFDLCSQANHKITAEILAELKKEKYDAEKYDTEI